MKTDRGILSSNAVPAFLADIVVPKPDVPEGHAGGVVTIGLSLRLPDDVLVDLLELADRHGVTTGVGVEAVMLMVMRAGLERLR